MPLYRIVYEYWACMGPDMTRETSWATNEEELEQVSRQVDKMGGKVLLVQEIQLVGEWRQQE